MFELCGEDKLLNGKNTLCAHTLNTVTVELESQNNLAWYVAAGDNVARPCIYLAMQRRRAATHTGEDKNRKTLSREAVQSVWLIVPTNAHTRTHTDTSKQNESSEIKFTIAFEQSASQAPAHGSSSQATLQ